MRQGLPAQYHRVCQKLQQEPRERHMEAAGDASRLLHTPDTIRALGMQLGFCFSSLSDILKGLGYLLLLWENRGNSLITVFSLGDGTLAPPVGNCQQSPHLSFP